MEKVLKIFFNSVICFIFIYILIQPLQGAGWVTMWTQIYTQSSPGSTANGMALDKNSGDVYVTGLGGRGASNYCTIRYDQNGQSIWTQEYDSGRFELAQGITVAPSGSIYVTGYRFTGVGNNYRCFTIKYDSSGNTNWTREFGKTESDNPWGITTDSSGNIYLALQCGWGVGNADYIILKYNSTGSTVWTQVYNHGNRDGATAVCADNSGYIYATGVNGNSGVENFLTVKLNNNKNTIWTQIYAKPNGNRGRGIGVDSGGNVYVTGRTNGATLDILTFKYDQNGTFLWSKRYDSGRSEETMDLVLDPCGYVYVAGYRNNGANDDYFIIKYDSSGNTVWTQVYNSGGSDQANAICVDSSGYVYVTGASGARYYFTIKYLQPPYPSAPSGLSGEFSSGDLITLSWQDNTINEWGFKIYRCDPGSSYNLIGRTSANSVQFQDSTVITGNTYLYKVIATNQAGETLPSNILEITAALPKVYTIESVVLVPNPFNPSENTKNYMTFFKIPDDVVIKIYDILGDKKAELSKPDSNHQVIWYGKDSDGKELGQGMYFASLEDSQGKKRTIKFIIQR